MACVALPFVEQKLGIAPGDPMPAKCSHAITGVLESIFLPLHMMIRLNLSAEKILFLQSIFDQGKCPKELFTSRSYPNSRELKIIRSAVDGLDPQQTDREWPLPQPALMKQSSPNSRKRKSRGGRSRKKQGGSSQADEEKQSV